MTEPPPIPATRPASMTADEQDRMILNYAILNGALELLPESHRVDGHHPASDEDGVPGRKGVRLRLGSRAHRRVPGGGRRGHGVAIRRADRREAGREAFRQEDARPAAGAAAKQAVSSGFSFATTYALGRLAVGTTRAGAPSRPQVLKDTYAGLLGEARGLQQQYLPAIQEKARTVNVAQGRGPAAAGDGLRGAWEPSCGRTGLPLQPRLWPSERWEEPSPPLGDDGHEPCRLPGVEQSSACLVPTEYASRISPGTRKESHHDTSILRVPPCCLPRDPCR